MLQHLFVRILHIIIKSCNFAQSLRELLKIPAIYKFNFYFGTFYRFYLLFCFFSASFCFSLSYNARIAPSFKDKNLLNKNPKFQIKQF